MVSINTNLSSLLVQNNLAQSTNSLSKAVERLTTGYKINHASDNAAGYSIAQDMTSKLSSYDVAADNISMGLDLLSVAQTTISQMQSRGERLMALWTQAQNGTFGPTSLSAINQEATAIMQEINRLYMNTEYNGIKLFDRNLNIPDNMPKAGESGFIDETDIEDIQAGTTGHVGTTGTVGLTSDIKAKYNGFIEEAHHISDAEVNALTHVSDIDNFVSGETYAITSADDLVKLASLVNAGKDSTNVTFVMGADLDISAYCAENTDGSGNGGWTPIGTSGASFNGTFDGNGHKIEGLYIKRTTSDYQGLFGYTAGDSIIENVGVEGNVTGQRFTGGLVGRIKGTISNCYTTGNVTGNRDYTGGLVGYTQANSSVTNSYTIGNVTGQSYTGGLVGYAYTNSAVSNSYTLGNVSGQSYTGGLIGEATLNSTVSNNYATGNVTGQGDYTGGLVGHANGSVSNSYTTGDVTGQGYTGGLVGYAYTSSSVTNCYASGTIIGQGDYTGGLVGKADGSVSNSYTTGTVTGKGQYTGGLVGWASCTVTNCYTTGNVTGQDSTGGLVGWASYVENCYSMGYVNGSEKVGGLVGWANDINNSYSTSDVLSTGDYLGGLAGYTNINHVISNCCSSGTVTGAENKKYIGGLVGYLNKDSTVTNSYATGNVTGKGQYTGGLVGYAHTNSTISNSYTTGTVTGKGQYTGGLVGYANTNSSVTNSYSTGNVTGQGNYTGGLVGQANGSVTNSYTTGNVTGQNQTGGLVGQARGSVTNSYTTGNVTGHGYSTGGLVGIAYGSVTNSYTTGNATGQNKTGGLVGFADDTVTNCYTTGNVTGQDFTGGLIGQTYIHGNIVNSYTTGCVTGKSLVGGLVGLTLTQDVDTTISDSISYSNVSGESSVGSLLGGQAGVYKYICEGVVEDEYRDGTLTISSCKAMSQALPQIGSYGSWVENDDEEGTTEYFEPDENYDFSELLSEIQTVKCDTGVRNFQVGVNGDKSSNIDITTSMNIDFSAVMRNGIESVKTFDVLQKFMSQLSNKATELGATSNRLESALESTTVAMENLTSSLSTIKDADIAKVSSEYIKKQILQQASATLLATANQSPSIALQLL